MPQPRFRRFHELATNVYLSQRGADVYLNEVGNGWSARITVDVPVADDFASVRIADLLGTGTACLVWSSSAPTAASAPLRYVDLLDSTKPHLLSRVVNGIGAETTIAYAPSTEYYLGDRAAGKPWATRVPFVVQTVAEVVTTDAVARTRFVSRYRYAHGFFDGVEREFRGFARVDHWDAESISSDHGAGEAPRQLVAVEGNYVLPPTHTISWFHTGAWNGERDDLRTTLAKELYQGDASAPPFVSTRVPATLEPPALREAFRALQGALLRQEVYAEDRTDLAPHPYVVRESRFEVRELQPIGPARHGVYHSFQREEVSLHYERRSSDPRIEHSLSLEVDPLGHIVRAAHVAYARRAAVAPEQARVLASCGTTTFAPPLSTPYDFRHGAVTEERQYEMALGASPTVLTLDAVDAAMTSATARAFDQPLAPGALRLLGHVRHQYWKDDLSVPLAVGTVETRALVYERSALALPESLLSAVFGSDVSAGELSTQSGYLIEGSDLWVHSGTTTYDGAFFYEPTSFANVFGNTRTVVYDPERLFIVEEHTSTDPAFDNVTTATIDYRVLASSQITDPNGNRSAAAFDPLGRVTALAVMGAAGEGDTLADPTSTIAYDLLGWEASPPRPASVHTRARIEHGASNPGWFEIFSYSDGSGHEVLKKMPAEPDASGKPRWVGTGRTVFDNKGNAVKRYEPYFAEDAGYDEEPALVATGYGEVRTYDPLSRLVRVDEPDGTFRTSTFDAWSETVADANDNVLESAWYADAAARPATDPVHRAAALAAKHAHTPEVRTVDPLGRAFMTTSDNGALGKSTTRVALDIQGNLLRVTDARGIVVQSQTFDVLGRVLRKDSTDAGASKAIADGAGGFYRAWDARGTALKYAYDTLRRASALWVTELGAPSATLAERTVYGEGVALPNLRGRIYQRFDGAGVVTHGAYDFEGQLTHASRRLARTYDAVPAWDALAMIVAPASFLPAASSLLEADVFDTFTSHDALHRVVSTTAPDGSVTAIGYNAASLVAIVDVRVRGSASTSPIVTRVDYNANGQRTAVAYGKGISSAYAYDARTHVSLRATTTRASDGALLQDLSTTYDPVGNVVQVTDGAQETVYFAGSVTSGTQLFEYDALYRLTHAEGREHPGQVGYALGPDGYPECALSTIPHPNDLQALLPYTEDYAYDAVGNLLSTQHKAGGAIGGAWTRTQMYAAASNRLERVSMPGDAAAGPYSGVHAHDASGNLSKTSNLTALTWDYAGRLLSADLGGGGTAYFTYDSGGQRVRKVVDRGGVFKERIYVGGYERYREKHGGSLALATTALEREGVHVSDGARRFALLETKTVDTSTTLLVATTLFRFQFPNGVGSASLETDASGFVISYEEYFPYGGTSFRSGDADKRYRYAGKERDEETGLYYFGARYYAPWLGRWLSCDPSGIAAGINLYVYCSDNPTSRTDPDGREDSWLGKAWTTASEIHAGMREAVTDVVVGTLNAGVERIERTGQELRAHPEMLAAGPTAGVAQAAISGETKHAVAEVKAATAAAGGGARGAAVAVNNLYNPGAPVVDAVEATAVAAAKGDVRATAKGGANIGITAASGFLQVLGAVEGAASLGGAIRGGGAPPFEGSGSAPAPGNGSVSAAVKKFVADKRGGAKIPWTQDASTPRTGEAAITDPGLAQFVGRLEDAGIKVTNTNISMVGEGGKVLGEIDVVTESALIQFKNGSSSARAVIDQVTRRTTPFVNRPVITFINDAGRAGLRTVNGAGGRIMITNEFSALVDLLR